MFRNILVPTDGSALSQRAIRQAVQFAKEQKARVTGLHVVPSYEPGLRDEASVLHYLSPQQYAERSRAVAQKHLAVVAKTAAAAGVRCELVQASGDYPFEEIVRAAQRKKCDLIYMASHGRRGIARLLLGSETSKVLAHSKVPVMVCR
jgi:nucleotide-binding universal stress UspA family protein